MYQGSRQGKVAFVFFVIPQWPETLKKPGSPQKKKTHTHTHTHTWEVQEEEMLIAGWEKFDCEDFKRTEPKQAARLPQAPLKIFP